jgi:Tol biopolymer transport system component
MGAFETQGITRSGSYHYTLGGIRGEPYEAEMDPQTGRLAKPAVPAAPGRAGAWSPDGQFVAYPGPPFGGGNPVRIVIQSLQSGDRHEFTTNLTNTPGVRWFPDGRSLLVAGGNPLGGIPISLHRFDVRTGEDLLRRTIGVRSGSDVGVSPDGRKVYYTTYDEQSVGRIMMYDLAADTESELYRTSPYKLNLALSPDGALIALVLLDEAKRACSLHVMPASGGSIREVFRARPGDMVGFRGIDWTPDGKHLIFDMPATPGGQNVDLWRVPIAGGEAKPLGLGPGNEMIAGPRLHPDGRRLSFVAATKRWEAWSLSNVMATMNNK